MEPAAQIYSPTREAIEAIENVYHSVQRVFPEALADFESKWMAYQKVCRSQPTSSSLDACTKTADFKALKNQGPKILTFVVFKLATDADQNLNGVFLFEALVDNSETVGNLDDPLTSKEALQRHRNQIVELSYQRNRIYEERVKLWKEYCAEYLLVLSRGVCCIGDEYLDLLEMGPAFIPHLMVEYAHDRDGFWYELLHEIVHGRQMEAHAIFEREKIFDVWREFLVGGEWDQAPKYVPNEWDIYIATGKIGPQAWEHFRHSGM